MSARPEPRDPAHPHLDRVRRACRTIETNLEALPSLADLAAEASLSPPHFQRVFKRVMGISPRQYADACRLGRLKAGLKARPTVTAALYEAGYGSSSRLYERAADQLGMTPATYRKGGPHTTIRYTTTDCALGRLLLAATARGVCAVSLADTDDVLEAFLQTEFPAARRERDDAELRDWATAVVGHLAGAQPHLDLPLDVRATAFQRRVWQELCRIPYGQTRTYSAVAAALGQPTATRAVARACATNPACIVIPCHRVIGRDGTLTGYRWGVDRKRQMLEQEQQPQARG